MVQQISLTQGKVALVDDEDYQQLAGFKWSLARQGQYARRAEYDPGTRKQRHIYLHREVLGLQKGEEADHINLDKLDCRRSNLRKCTHQQNMCNRNGVANAASRYCGVTRDKGATKWRARLHTGGRVYHLGMYSTEEAAARAYDAAAIKHFGEFARLNFPQESAS